MSSTAASRQAQNDLLNSFLLLTHIIAQTSKLIKKTYSVEKTSSDPQYVTYVSLCVPDRNIC